jgi:hypothetical protein
MKTTSLLAIIILIISSCAGTKEMTKEMIISEYASACPDSTESTILMHTKSQIDADSSIFYGHVLHNSNYKPMIGATVVLTKVDTRKQIGAVTDFEGKFLIILDAGTYDMEVNSIGSDSVVVTNLEIYNKEIHKFLVGLNCHDFSEIVVRTGHRVVE